MSTCGASQIETNSIIRYQGRTPDGSLQPARTAPQARCHITITPDRTKQLVCNVWLHGYNIWWKLRPAPLLLNIRFAARAKSTCERARHHRKVAIFLDTKVDFSLDKQSTVVCAICTSVATATSAHVSDVVAHYGNKNVRKESTVYFSV